MESTNALGITKENSDNSGNIPYLYEWRFNLQTGVVQEKALGEIACEFPRINEKYLGRKNRYGYAGKLKLEEMALLEGLLKYDLETGKTEIHSFEPNCYGGEAVFVPHPQAQSEDHGWLLTFIYDEASNSSELIVLDAQNFTQNAIARIIMPQRVPYGFHGAWVDSEQFA
jgi:carotenoid cleavage dioxygenase